MASALLISRAMNWPLKFPQSSLSALMALATVMVMSQVGCTLRSGAGEFIEQTPLLSLDETLALAQIYCEDSASCHPSVGYILSVSTQERKRGVMQCTGSLIAPNIIATNSHCIPIDLRSPGAPCSERVGIKFPPSAGFAGYAAETYRCRRILSASKISEEGQPGHAFTPDYAFFEIERTSRRPSLTLSREGISSVASLNLFVVDPMSEKTPIGRLTKKVCTPNGRFHGGTSMPLSPMIELSGSGCTVRQGNSGAPVLAGNKMIALLHGGKGKKDALTTAIVTNLACAASPPTLDPLWTKEHRIPRCSF